MLWRNLLLVRAVAASGLLTFSTLGASLAGEPSEPIPGDDGAAETVKILDAEKAGTLAVDVRGNGPDRVHVKLKNNSDRRLHVVLPPGLVASSATGQGGGAGGGGGGGFQSMGLGAVGNNPGAFGRFAGNNGGSNAFRSVAPAEDPALTLPAGQKVEFDVPAVCLNFGVTTPTPRDKFRLVDVDDYSTDVRLRKALRSLANLGTGRGVAQAVAWKVANNVPFELMMEKDPKHINPAEVALAARFIEVLDRSSSAEPVDPAYLAEARVFATIEGDGPLARDAKRLGAELDGLRVLGLPVRLTATGEAPKASPALHLAVTLLSGPSGEARAKVVVRSSTGDPDSAKWRTLGQVSLTLGDAPSTLDGAALARSLDRAVASGFVSARVFARSNGGSTIRIENRLPFSLAGVSIKSSQSAGAPAIDLPALGVGPGRSATATIPAPGGSVERVELNGL